MLKILLSQMMQNIDINFYTHLGHSLTFLKRSLHFLTLSYYESLMIIFPFPYLLGWVLVSTTWDANGKNVDTTLSYHHNNKTTLVGSAPTPVA